MKEIQLEDDVRISLRNIMHTHRSMINSAQKHASLPNLLDDEYAKLGTYEPKIMLTTSRAPSSKLTQFVKELKILFPNAERINRGTNVLPELVESCRRSGVTDLVLVHETRYVLHARYY
jgi:U3 small nucleolar ribonucleoprotein protein IMP4